MNEIVEYIENNVSSSGRANEMIDGLVIWMLDNFPAYDFPITHRFTQGMYIREMFAPKGSIIVSKIHRTEHPFVISKGRISVWDDQDLERLLVAPFTGITKPGTRRFAYVHEDCIWTTFHCITDGETVEQIEDRIIEPHINPMIGNRYFEEIERLKDHRIKQLS